MCQTGLYNIEFCILYHGAEGCGILGALSKISPHLAKPVGFKVEQRSSDMLSLC